MNALFNRESLQNAGCLTVSSAIGFALIGWSGTQLYVYYCAPSGFSGFLQSLVTMDSTPCQALFSLISHSQSLYAATIASLLFAFVTFIGACMSPNTPKKPFYP